MTNIAITGHRPERVAEYEPQIRQALREAYEHLHAYRVIHGCAAGVDMWAAQEAFLADIPYVAARPWMGHAPRKIDREAYKIMLKNADEIVNLDAADEYPGSHVYHNRNKWMVDRADWVVGVWDGYPKGGTHAALSYARDSGKKMYVIHPETGEAVASHSLPS